jgi:hypothetical protein
MGMLATWLVRAGLAAIAFAALFVLLGFFRPLYETVVPGDEGGTAYLLFIYAWVLVPAGLVMLSAGFAVKCSVDRYSSERKVMVASVLFGTSIWCIVRAVMGSIGVKWWAVSAGALAAAPVFLWLRLRASARPETPRRLTNKRQQ